MKKKILTVGKALDRLEQKQINGGYNCIQAFQFCVPVNPVIPSGLCCPGLVCVNNSPTFDRGTCEYR